MNAQDLLEAVVQIPSPSGDEAEAVGFMQDQARDDGLDVRRDGVGNLIVEAGRGERHLAFVGHIDTVPGVLPVHRDTQRLTGRGTVDAKGPLVAAYDAARRAMDDDTIRWTVVGAVGEEADSRGVRDLRLDAPDWIINGEPSGWDGITTGYKGLVRGTFHAAGAPVHGGHPQPGALDRCTSWWASVRAQLGHGTGFDGVQCRLDAMHSGCDGLTEQAEGRFQVRLPPGTDARETAARLRRAAAPHEVDLDLEDPVGAALADPRSPLATALRGAIRAAGGRPRVLHKTGTSDFNILHERFPDVPIVAYGPGDSALDHTPQEQLPWDDLRRSIEVLTDAARRLPDIAARSRRHEVDVPA